MDMFRKLAGFMLINLMLLSAVCADSFNSALIRQVGDGHHAQVTQSGHNSDASILQGGEFGLAETAQGVLIGAWKVGDLFNAPKKLLDVADDIAIFTVSAGMQAGAGTGSGNDASIEISGNQSTGNLLQNGNGNVGRLVISGDNAKGTLWQLGNNNDAGLAVTSNGTKVLYTQRGNGLKTQNLGAAAPGEGWTDGNMLIVDAPHNTITVHQQ